MAADQDRRKDDPRVDVLVSDVASLRQEVADNTEMTREVKANTADFVEFLNDSKAAFRLFNRSMKVLRWIVKTAVLPGVLIIAGYYAWRHEGRPPGWLKYWLEVL